MTVRSNKTWENNLAELLAGRMMDRQFTILSGQLVDSDGEDVYLNLSVLIPLDRGAALASGKGAGSARSSS